MRDPEMPVEEGQNFLADSTACVSQGAAGVIENHLGLGIVAVLSLTAQG